VYKIHNKETWIVEEGHRAAARIDGNVLGENSHLKGFGRVIIYLDYTNGKIMNVMTGS